MQAYFLYRSIYHSALRVFMSKALFGKPCIEKEVFMPENEMAYRELFEELSRYEQRGVYLVMEGTPASPTQIVRAHMLKEDSGYMRDYILNEKGDLKELYFHHINP